MDAHSRKAFVCSVAASSGQSESFPEAPKPKQQGLDLLLKLVCSFSTSVLALGFFSGICLASREMVEDTILRHFKLI